MIVSSIAICLLLSGTEGLAQQKAKRPLSHDVYDSWTRVAGETISNDARWIMYTIEPQEGDARLVLYNISTGATDTIPRGVNARFSEHSDFAAFTIKALFADMRKARNAKKKPDDQPKDSLGLISLGKSGVVRIPRVKSFKLPERGSGWIAYQLEKPPAPPDSTRKQKLSPRDADAADDQGKDGKEEKGTTVVFRELSTAKEYTFPNVRDYVLTKDGTRLLFTATGNDSTIAAGVFVFSTATRSVDTIAIGRGTYKQPAWDEAGTQAAFVADRDTSKSKQRYYALHYWKAGMDSAAVIADTLTRGMYSHWLVSENGRLLFSRDGTKLFFGTAPVPMPDDTTLIDEETAKLDVWNWQDPILQSQQLKNLEDEKKRSFTAVIHLADRQFVQLGDTLLPTIVTGDEGNAPVALGLSDLPYRRTQSWEGRAAFDLVSVDVRTGVRTRLLTRITGGASLSPGARYITWFDLKRKSWFALSTRGGIPVNLTAAIKVPLFDELFDMPDDPGAYGELGWITRDSLFMVYDRHDIWVTDPTGARPAWCMTRGNGRASNLRYRYVRLDHEERYLNPGAAMLLQTFNYKDRSSGFSGTQAGVAAIPRPFVMTAHTYSTPLKADSAATLIYTRGNFTEPPDLYVASMDFSAPRRISDCVPQQREYLWGTVELFSWNGADGKPLDGLLYKPEGFDPRRKYPMIVYYYERNSDFLHRYLQPAPSRSSVNIPLFVSRGYIVFFPDIRYKIGHPGQSAYDCIVPGVKALIARGFVDKDRVGLEGQSWGGYQTAFLVTRTKMFRAAMAGAAVSNMTSAYGGIRWESGLVRMFQYERAQSRIGATLWERPDLYIENSPLFRADSIRTPLLLMNNDADGAVPWYQGIELFNALRRLNRPVWLLNYNGDAHNLLQRKNQKDLSIRMLQFFDHYLMNAPAPRWMAEGLPAVEKGKTMKYELGTGAP